MVVEKVVPGEWPNSAHCPSQPPSIGKVHPQRAPAMPRICIVREVGLIRVEDSTFDEERYATASQCIPSAVFFVRRPEREFGVQTVVK